jgi:SagB-type dehydrogenase family enzyme
MRHLVAKAALNQEWVAEAPAIVVVTAIDSRTTGKYGPRGVRYVHMEVGHASQNLLLEAVALGLGGAVVGAFDDADLKRLLRLPGEEHPLAILPVGHPR